MIKRWGIMKEVDWRSFIRKDLPKIGPITKETVQYTLENAARFRGSVRSSLGRIWTDEDYEERRNRILNTPLP